MASLIVAGASVVAVFVLALMYALKARDAARLEVAGGKLQADIERLQGTLMASQEQRKRLAVTVARYSRELRELEEEFEEASIHLPIANRDAIRLLLDRMFAPNEDHPDPRLGPVPDWITADDADDNTD
jgi:hypothetical protein